MNDGRKYDSGKADYSLVPAAALEAIVLALTYGAQKYGADNWRMVADGRRRYFSALMRHAWAAFLDASAVDEESGLPHYAHAGACILFLLCALTGDAPTP